MHLAFRWIPIAGCVVALIYLAMALSASHEMMKAAYATVALAFAIVPYLTAKLLQAALSERD